MNESWRQVSGRRVDLGCASGSHIGTREQDLDMRVRKPEREREGSCLLQGPPLHRPTNEAVTALPPPSTLASLPPCHAAGVFVPMLLIGACVGRLVGLFMVDMAARSGKGSPG